MKIIRLIKVIFVLGLVLLTEIIVWSQPAGTTDHLIIDQFGYTTSMQKICLINNPIQGFNSGESFIPSSTLQVRRLADHTISFEAEPVPWGNGEIHEQSGDKVWCFDFSELNETGSFYIYDPEKNLASYHFIINDSVYNLILKHAVRSYYYQRCGTPKETPYAHENWTDQACHLGLFQDNDCRLINNLSDSTSKNLNGGWHDAGDYNKYVNYAYSTLHDLLFAYEENPGVWSDDFSIPESGNGIPDILDEVKWELNWLLKMQTINGSVLHKVSAINWDDAESPPSNEGTRRCYAPPTASATISSCGVFAHAAIVYRSVGNEALNLFADTLEQAALAAWLWIEQNPEQIPSDYDNEGFQNATAELPEYTQFALITVCASYLFNLSGDNQFKDYFDEHFQSTHLFTWGAVHYIYDDPVIIDGLLYYSKSPGATTWVVEAIMESYLEAMTAEWNDIAPVYDYQEMKDSYLAYLDDYSWGSNQNKGTVGTFITLLNTYHIPCCTENEIENMSAGFMHYLHGVNPMALVYLTNMSAFGAENSVPELYHLWFADGTEWDNVENDLYGPAPGILVGGPNEFYESPGAESIVPPENQPAQKSYKSWNSSAEHSWEVTENQITYQAAYIRLVSKYASGNGQNNSVKEKNTDEQVEVSISPNPFSDFTTINFKISEKSAVDLFIIDNTGRVVDHKDLGILEKGCNSIIWDAGSFCNGHYYCKIVAGKESGKIKMLLKK